MTERPLPPTSPQETSPLHEQGGLTPRHWQEVLRILPGEPKIVHYSQAIINGELEEGHV